MSTAVLAGLVASGAWGQGIVAAAGGTAAAAKTTEVLLPNAAFDVATIKPADPNAMGGSAGIRPNGTFFLKNQPLKQVICNADGLPLNVQCVGGPGWLESERYDIEAKPDGSTAEQLLKLGWKEREPVQQRMQQALLVDRLKLKAHLETREMTVFALVVAKGGLKMHEATPGDKYANGAKRDDGKPYGKVFSIGNGTVTQQGMSLDTLVMNLPGITGHFVENKTGLTGVYDFTLKYSPVDPPPPDSTLPSFYTALEEQLGLKLEPTKGPVQVLVIDHVERPSEN